MSRSWERKVQKNQQQINRQRKKQGQSPLQVTSEQIDKFKGRSIILPAFVLLMIVSYVILSASSQYAEQNSMMFWVTIVLYVLLAVLFVFRRPYLSVGKDFVRTRRFGGDRMLYRDNIQSISVQKGYVVISPKKGGNWVFSRLINLYPTDEMTERLRSFATNNQIPFEQK